MKSVSIIFAMLAMATSSAPAKEAENAKTAEGTLILYKGQQFSGEDYRIMKANPAIPHEFLVGSMAPYPGEKWEVCDKPKYKGNCIIVVGEETDMGRAVIESARPVE